MRMYETFCKAILFKGGVERNLDIMVEGMN